MRSARQKWPNLVTKLRLDGVAELTRREVENADLRKRDDAPEVPAFSKVVDTIQKRDRVSRLEALRRAARRLTPEQFAAYRARMS